MKLARALDDITLVHDHLLYIAFVFMTQPEVDSFCVCLDTWGVFLDHLIMMTSSDAYGGQSPPTNNHYER